MAGQEIARSQHLLQVLFVGHIAEARRGAELQVAVETMLVIIFVWRERTAPAQIELPPHQRQSPAQPAGIGKWTEITRTVVGLESRESEAGDRIAQIDLEQKKRLSSREVKLYCGWNS